ncbi:MAG: nucleotidyltransferase domain-containing protein [Candidatus Helarchaeota archaeon]
MLLLYKDKILKEIGEEFPKLDIDLVEILVFGSVARDDFTPLSDIDILMITNNQKRTKEKFTRFIEQIYLETSIVVSPKYLTPIEFQNTIDPFYKIIKIEGKRLWKRKRN